MYFLGTCFLYFPSIFSMNLSCQTWVCCTSFFVWDCKGTTFFITSKFFSYFFAKISTFVLKSCKKRQNWPKNDFSLANIPCLRKDWSIHNRWRNPDDCCNKVGACRKKMVEWRRFHRHYHSCPDSARSFCSKHFHSYRPSAPLNKGQHCSDSCKLPASFPYNINGRDVFHSIQGQWIRDLSLQGNQTCGGGADRSSDDRYDQGDKDEMVVMGTRHFFNDPCMLPESISYIYINMCNRDGTGRLMV